MFLENASRKGWIEVVCGSMFSGKTEELIRRLKRAQFAHQRVEIFKPRIDVRYSEEEVVSRCENPSCPAKLRESLLHFAGRRAMDIEGLGDVLVGQLLERRMVDDIAGLYALTVEQLQDLERMGRRSAENVVREIAGSRGRELAALALG